MTTPGHPAATNGLILMGDPRVTAIPVTDNGEDLVDVRGRGLRVSGLVADDAGNYAHVRVGLAGRLTQAQQTLPPGVHLLLIEGYRPPSSGATSPSTSPRCAGPAPAAARRSSGCWPAGT